MEVGPEEGMLTFQNSEDEDVRLWCPSMQEVTEVVHSLGTHDPALPPPGPFPHSGSMLKSAASPRWSEQQDTPREAALDISLSCICKFLTLCALAQPGTYTDRHLLGLMELLCRASLDVGLRLLPKTDLQQLLLLLLENIREWPGKLRHLCCTLSQASDHHHNLLALVQLFLDVTSRSRQLRSQLSLLIIARLLGRQEMLPLWQEKAQLSSLSQLLSLMRPSSLEQYLGSETLPLGWEKQPKASAQLDHKEAQCGAVDLGMLAACLPVRLALLVLCGLARLVSRGCSVSLTAQLREDTGAEVLAEGVGREGSALKEKRRESSDVRGTVFPDAELGPASLFLFTVVLTEAESLAFPQFLLIDFPDIARLS
ncbi:hypothetical protein CB1_000321016 [Camelus ferus]|nr:hypothetical protein CB1_000321016 [Camelus ferus]